MNEFPEEIKTYFLTQEHYTWSIHMEALKSHISNKMLDYNEN